MRRALMILAASMLGCGPAPSADVDGGTPDSDASEPDAGPPLAPDPWAVPPVQVAAIATRACAVVEDGRVACWGASAKTAVGSSAPGGCEDDVIRGGELLEPVPRPRWVEGVTDAVEVAVALRTSCARTRGGEVLCWGRSFDESCPISAPRVVPDVTDVVQLRAAPANEGICALHADGTVTCWTSTQAPRSIPGLSGVRELAVTTFGSCAIVADDRVRCFAHVLDDPMLEDYAVEDAQQIAALGRGDFCVVDSGGAVRCRGAATQALDGSYEGEELSGLPPIAGVALGDLNNTCVWSTEGEVFCFGTNERGQLGVGTTEVHREPVRVAGLDDVSQLAGAEGYACAVRRSGGLACWGTGWLGSDPLFHYAPLEVVGVERTTSASARSGGTCAVDDAGALRCWGLLDESSDPRGALVPTVMPTRGPVRESCGAWCALLTDGTVECPHGAPYRPTLTALEGVDDIGCGTSHDCVIANGFVQCEGYDAAGVLGDGRVTDDRRAGDPLTGMGEVVELGVGSYHACARSAGGDVHCWGNNRQGQAGGTEDAVLEPVLVARGADRLVVGGGTSCVARAGAWSCWGDLYTLGALCEGPCGLPSESATEVALPFEVTELSLSGGLVCAASPTGPVRCSGWETVAEGYSSGRSRVALAIDGTDDTVALVGTPRHACAVAADGRMRCWGSNERGQLGAENAGSRAIPIPVPSPE